MTSRYPLAPEVTVAGPTGSIKTVARTLAALAVATAALMSWPADGDAATVHYLLGQHTWTVPPRVFSATFDLHGAQGSPGYEGNGGLGGRTTVAIAVTPGQVFQLNVGGMGGENGAGGANGGGQGGGPSGNGGGGGGATDVRTGPFGLSERLAVAGGGGGGGNFSSDSTSSDGGGGGGMWGHAGILQGGQGGSQSGGGAGWSGGGSGAFGVGGAGACDGGGTCGGGGGGGWYGGGGGGGGGSGHAPEGTTFDRALRAGDGLATITYFETFTPPVAVTKTASSVTTTDAVLGGSVNPSGTATTYRFEYGTTASYGSSTADQSAGSGDADHDATRAISGLSPSTTYHFRIVATNGSGTSVGSDVAFTTGGPQPPPTPPPPPDAPPTVSFTAPAAGLMLSTKVPTVLSASATDDLGVARVDFLDDDRVVCSDVVAPYACEYRPRGEDVGRNTLLVLAYDTSGQTATAVRAVTVPRFSAKRLRATTMALRDGTSPLRLVTTGVLALPEGVTKAMGCKGTVTLRIKDGSATVARRRAKVGPTCRFRSVTTLSNPQRLDQARLGIAVRFRGNEILRPRAARRTSVPLPR